MGDLNGKGKALVIAGAILIISASLFGWFPLALGFLLLFLGLREKVSVPIPKSETTAKLPPR